MTHTKEYPMPTVHMNGTSKERLLKGNMDILDKIHNLEDTICNCVFHGRDYYVLDADPYSLESYQAALKERQKHTQALRDFREYIEEQINHIDAQ
jgi:hypothetical protein